MKIAHISDLHICSRFRRENILRTEQLLEHAHSEKIDHLLISGDISHDSTIEDFKIFRELLYQYDFLHSKRASICIGNHDIYGGVHLATDIINFPTRCKTTSMNEKIETFHGIFEELFEDTITINKGNPFPYAKELRDTVIFGLNTNMIYSAWRNPMASNGKLEDNEWEDLKILLSKAEYASKNKIVLAHHHFLHKNKEYVSSLWKLIEKMTMRLYKNKRITRLFSKNDVSLVLHGHVHYNDVYEINNVTFVSGGGSVESDFKEDKCHINLINLEKNKLDVKIVALEPPRIEPRIEPVPVFPNIKIHRQPELARA